MGAASRAMSAGRKPPRHAPKGTIEGGQFIGRSSITHALIRQLLGIGEREQGPDVRRGTGRFTTRGGSVASLVLPSRAPRVDDRVRDPRTGKLGRVLAISPVTDTRHFRPGETEPRAGQLHPASARVAWDDGRVETRPLSELADPFAEQPLRDPARSFDTARGPEQQRMDTAVASGIPGRPRTAAERMRDAVAGGRVESGVAKRLLRGESPASIVDSGTKEGWRDAQRAKLSIAQRDALNGLAADQQELYWLRRAAGQDHGAAMDSVGAPGPVKKAAAARKMATPKAPRAPAKPKRLGIDEFDGRPRSAWMADARKAGVKVPAGAPAHEVAWLTQEERVRSGALMGAGGFSTNPAIRASAERYLSGDTQGGIEDRVAALRAQHEARVAALGIDTSTPAPATKATAAQRMSRTDLTGEGRTKADVLRAASTPEEAGRYLADLPASSVAVIADELGVPRVPGARRGGPAQRAGIMEHLFPGSALPKKPTAAQRMSRAAKRPPADIAAALRSATTRDEADAHLQGLTVADLTAVADELGISRSALRGNGSRKEDIRSSLVNLEVGGRASFAAMRNLPGSSERFRAPDASPAVAKMARGKAPTGPRSSGLPAKPTLTDFEDLADRISRLRTEGQRLEILQDLNAGELNRLAGRFPGGVGINPSGYMSHRQTALKIPAGLSLEERRRWLATELTPVDQRRPKAEGAVAKMARAAAPQVAAAAGKSDGPQVRRAYTFDMGPGVAEQYGRIGGDEPLYLPNRGADQGLVHLDSQLGSLWTDLTADNREPNSFVNAVARIGEDVGRGTISLDQAANRLRALSTNATDQAVVRRIEATIRGITEPTPAPSIDVPSNVPPSIRLWLEDLAQIPTMRKTDLPGNRREQSVLDEALALVREISQQGITGQRTMSMGDAEMRLLGITQNVHESIDGVYHARRLTGRTFAGPTIVTGYRQGPGGRTEEITEPNPDWPEIRDWLRGRR